MSETPQFKVGDKVRIKASGRSGTVEAVGIQVINHPDGILVSTDARDYSYYYLPHMLEFDPRDLALAAALRKLAIAEAALREIAQCRVTMPRPIPATEWGKGYAAAMIRFTGVADSALRALAADDSAGDGNGGGR